MRKTLLSVLLFSLCVGSHLSAQLVEDYDAELLEPETPDAVASYSFELRNDTLFVNCAEDIMPKHVVLLTAQKENIYKRIFNDQTDDLMEDHPAADIYNNIWTRERVNPYKTPIDSLPDSVRINVSEFCLPTPGYITSKFGPRRYRYHYGTDIKLQIGDTVRCAYNGQVRIVDYEQKGYGHYVVVRHDNGLETVYAHLSRVLVEENDRIFCGEPVGLGGNTGRSTGSHLHFEIRYLGNAINTELLLNYETGQMRDSTYLITKKQTYYHNEDLKQMAQAKYITIKAGDNLSTIARRHGTTVQRLCALNKIKPTSILRIGQRLRVR